MKAKTKLTKLWSFLLSLVMLLSLLPTTALAADTYPEANEVSVDDGKYFAEPGHYYFKNGASACSKDPNNYNAYYNPRTGTLTLDGVSIDAGAVLPAEDFALVPMGKLAAQASPSGAEPAALTTEGTNEQQETEPPLAPPVMKVPLRAARGSDAFGSIVLDFGNDQTITLRGYDYITECTPNAEVKTVSEFDAQEFKTTGNYVAYMCGTDLHLKGNLNGACIKLNHVAEKLYSDVYVQDDTTISGNNCLLFNYGKGIYLHIRPGKTLTLNLESPGTHKYTGAIRTQSGGDVEIYGGGTLNINFNGSGNTAVTNGKLVYGIHAGNVTMENGSKTGFAGSPTVNINMDNGGSDFNGDAVMGIDANVLTVKDKARLNIEVTGRALDPTKEGISYAEGATQGRVNMAIRADSMKLLDSASVDITSHANVISDIYLTGEGEVLTVNTTGHLNIKNEGNIDRYPKEDDGVDTRDLPDGNIKVPTGASVKFEKAQEGIFIDSYSKQINKWYDDDIAGNGDLNDHWAIGGSLVLVNGMYRGDHRVGDWEKVNGNNFDIIWGSAKFIYSPHGVHTVKVSRGIGMAQNDASNNPTGRVKEPEFNDIYIVRPGDWLELTAPAGKGKFLYWYDATSDENTEGGTKWTNQTQYFQNIQKDMLLVPVYDVMTKEPTLGPLRYMNGGEIASNYSSQYLDFAYNDTGIDHSGGSRVLLVPARLPKYGEAVQYVTMLDGRKCVSFKPGTLFADENHPSAGAAYNYMSIAPGKYRIAVGDWDGGHGNWYFSEPFDFNPPIAPPYVTPKSTFFQEAGSQQVKITAERNAAIQYRLWDYDTNAWSNYRDYTGPFTVSYTADRDARIEAKATGSAEGVTTKVEYAVRPTAIPTVKYGDQVLAHPGSAYASERYYYQSMELQVEPIEGYDIYYRVGYEPSGGSNGSEISGTKLEEDGKVTISGTGTEQEYVYFRARKSLPGREGEWSRTSARLTLKEVTALPVPNVTFYDGDTKVTPDSDNTVFFHERLTAVLSETTHWPINAEMGYSRLTYGGLEVYQAPVKYTAEGILRVYTQATLADGSSESGEKVAYTIQQDASHVKKTLSVRKDSGIKVYDINNVLLTPSNPNAINHSYTLNVGRQFTVEAAPSSGGNIFYKWSFPEGTVVDDLYSPTTTFAMPDMDFTLEAEYKAPEVITKNTNIILNADKPAGKSLTLSQAVNGAFSEWRHLKYQWYEGDSVTDTPLNSFDSFETGKTYTARVTITVTEGCTFADGVGVRTKTDPSSGYIGVVESELTRADDKKSIAFDLHLLTKPELTMELAPGDTLPTAADLTAQLPEGYTVKSLTWADGATTAPSGAAVTITKLEIVPADGSYQLANRSVWINGTERTGTYNGYTLTLTNIDLPVKPKGVTVSGTVTSYGSDSDDVTVQLTESGASEPAYETIVKGNSATYSIAGVAPGTYTMKVMKNNHVTREYTVIVGTNPVVQDVEIWLLGDVNGDGTINVKDKKLIFNHLNDPSGALTGYALDVGDVNRDGTINVKDKKLIFNHLKGISLWS